MTRAINPTMAFIPFLMEVISLPPRYSPVHTPGIPSGHSVALAAAAVTAGAVTSVARPPPPPAVFVASVLLTSPHADTPPRGPSRPPRKTRRRPIRSWKTKGETRNFTEEEEVDVDMLLLPILAARSARVYSVGVNIRASLRFVKQPPCSVRWRREFETLEGSS